MNIGEESIGITAVAKDIIIKPTTINSFSPNLLSAKNPAGNSNKTNGKSIIININPILSQPNPISLLRSRGKYITIQA